MKERTEPPQTDNYSVLGMRVFRRTRHSCRNIFQEREVGVCSCAIWQMETTKNVDHSKDFRNRMGKFSNVLILRFS
jgi:hypothetical protein